uniref:TBC1 domain family member 4 n=1 Tax=Naja naja TaxID=35670 RepID=A0A8C6XV63_NAJNA
GQGEGGAGTAAPFPNGGSSSSSSSSSFGCLPRLATLPMLPWLMAEVRRRSQKPEPGAAAAAAREVLLLLGSPTLRCVPSSPGGAPGSAVFIFEHKAQHISRFVHNSQDLTYFAYLIKAQPDDPDSPVACHVFRATDPNQVPDVISSIRQASKVALKEDVKPNKENEDAFYNSQKFEVLYCGKVTVAHKKAPSSLIDDCIEKFHLHEHGPSSPLDSPFQEMEGSSGGTPGMFIVGSHTNLASLASCRTSFPERILEDSGVEDQLEFRSRCSSAASLQKRAQEHNSKPSSRRRHASAPSHVQPSDSEKNRTMLFQVGRFEINLISPDSKSVVLEKNFKDISSCSQGIKHIDHFGFICRESTEPGISQYACYVFQCASESLVDEIMLTLKQAFSTAAALQNAKTQVKLCEACPMHSLHKLCERIEGLYPPRAKLVIQRHLSSLSDNEQADIFERVQKMKPVSDQEENELLIFHLRQLCEAKQKTHIHIDEAPMVSFLSSVASQELQTSSGRFTLDILKNKAKKSLTSSLENIFSRGNIQNTQLGLGCVSLKPTPSTDTGYHLLNSRLTKWFFPDGCDEKELLPLSPLPPPSFDEVPLISLLQNEDVQDQSGEKKNSEELQSLWRKAIHQQILLLRMEKENQKLEASRDELQSRKIKLDYEEVGTCQKDVISIWDKKLLNCRAKIRCDVEDIHTTLKDGVPKSRRGEIWQFLAVQHRVRHRLPNKQQPPDISYKDLLKQLTTQQHAILVDLGRTFPTHPYFSAQLGAGQLSLFNLLKAYSLLDKEVGYCQGISFVAGVLLLHMSEEQAFEMLKFLMYDLGFRKQYRPDMMSLQIQMYQLSRLLHDYHRDLYHHLEENEISPSLYAAPWFLTLFASQFPLGFVARIFDIIFLQGTEVIFKVALCLLSTQEESIMSCETFEGIVEFLKNTLPDMTQPQMEKIMAQVFEMDISKQLHAYEVEYHVLQDELQESLSPCEEIEASEKLERANSQLKRQNMDLLEKLQVAYAKIQGVESNLEEALRRESQMMTLIQSLEEEKALYQKALEKICSYLPQEALSDCEELLKEVNCPPNKF